MSSASWYLLKKGKTIGPHTLAELKQKVKAEELGPFDLVYEEGASRWREVIECKEFKALFAEEALLSKVKQWVVLKKVDGKKVQHGPCETEEVRRLLEVGELSFQDWAWKKGMKEWYRIGTLRPFTRRKTARVDFYSSPEELSSMEDTIDGVTVPAETPKDPDPLGNVMVMRKATRVLDVEERPPEASGEDLTKAQPEQRQGSLPGVVGKAHLEVKKAKRKKSKFKKESRVRPGENIVNRFQSRLKASKWLAGFIRSTNLQSGLYWLIHIVVGLVVAGGAGYYLVYHSGMKSENWAIKMPGDFSNKESFSKKKKTKQKTAVSAVEANVKSRTKSKAEAKTKKDPAKRALLKKSVPKAAVTSVSIETSSLKRNGIVKVRTNGNTGWLQFTIQSQFSRLVEARGVLQRFQRRAGKELKLDLKALRLPEGSYHLTVESGKVSKKVTFFFGKNNKQYQQKLSRQRKKMSFFYQQERRHLVNWVGQLERAVQSGAKGKRSSNYGRVRKWNHALFSDRKKYSVKGYVMVDSWRTLAGLRKEYLRLQAQKNAPAQQWHSLSASVQSLLRQVKQRRLVP